MSHNFYLCEFQSKSRVQRRLLSALSISGEREVSPASDVPNTWPEFNLFKNQTWSTPLKRCLVTFYLLLYCVPWLSSVIKSNQSYDDSAARLHSQRTDCTWSTSSHVKTRVTRTSLSLLHTPLATAVSSERRRCQTVTPFYNGTLDS